MEEHMVRTYRAVAAWVVVAALAACSGSSDGTKGGGPGNTDLSTIDSAMRTLYGAYVDRVAACGQYAPWLSAAMKAEAVGWGAALADAQGRGRLGYDRAHAESCAAWVAGATCAELEEAYGMATPTCAAMVVGKVASGGACNAGVECANGYCTSDVLAVCPGTCEALVANGNSCADWMQCQSGACDGSVCVADVPGAAGQPCGFGDFACQSGLFCDASDVCRQRLGAGADCSTGECAFGLACADDATCRTLVGIGTDCTSAACGDGSYCSATTGKCVALPTRGTPCDELGHCFDGSHCSTGGTCVAGTVPVDRDCDHTNDLFCVDGTYCSAFQGAGTCVAIPTDACY
jgi:hypothetical protein